MNKYRFILDRRSQTFQVLCMELPICIMAHPDFQELPLFRSIWCIETHGGMYLSDPPHQYITEIWVKQDEYKYCYHYLKDTDDSIEDMLFNLIDKLNKQQYLTRVVNRFEDLLEN
jgi:hypothetical protein